MAKSLTKNERSYQDRIREHGCVICGDPCQIHHLRTGVGMGQRNSHYMVIGLCPEHHVGAFSIHMDRRGFEAVYGDELKLLAHTIERLHES